MKSFVSPEPYPVLEIQSSNLKHNLNIFRRTLDQHNGHTVKILIPVKANAYGFGMDTLMPFFIENDIDCLGVANPKEGARARSLGWTKPLLNLGSFFEQNIDYFFEHNITPTIVHPDQISILDRKAASLSEVLKVHIKWDTGMGRLGISPDDYPCIIEKLKSTSHLKISGLYTHFPRADSGSANPTERQRRLFDEITKKIIIDLALNREELVLHSANSYASILHPKTHYDMIRPGILFYGYFQTMNDRKKYEKNFPFRGGLSLKARPFSIRKLRKNDTISYGSTFRVKNEMLAGVLPLGYADGIPRSLSNKMKFGAHRLIGRVTMDQIILSDVTEDKPIELISNNTQPLEYWADLDGTISYELLTGLGLRLRRILV